MSMNIPKWAPWNWLKDEDNSSSAPHHSAVTDRIQSRNYNYHGLEPKKTIAKSERTKVIDTKSVA